jgi:acid phosphatase
VHAIGFGWVLTLFGRGTVRTPLPEPKNQVAPFVDPGVAHVVLIVLENCSPANAAKQSFLIDRATEGTLLRKYYAVAHPSQPNYIALFSGSTKGVGDDSCPRQLSGPNLASQLGAAGMSFTGYSEDLPAPGFTGCGSGTYARKHNPWADFAGVPATANQPFAAFPSDYAALPSVAVVVPNLDDDMHDGSIRAGDGWLAQHLGGYARWAPGHDSLLLVTWDEDDFGASNHIATILTGAHVRPGATFGARTDHYSTLRLIEDSLGLAHLGAAATARQVTGTWR